MVKKKRRVLEITEFKIKTPNEEEELRKTTDKANKFFEKQKGFEHQMILRDKTKFFNMIQWRNIDNAKDALKEAKKSEECKDFFEIIRPNSIKSVYPELVKMY